MDGMCLFRYIVMSNPLKPDPCHPDKIWCCMDFLPEKDDYEPTDEPWMADLVYGNGYWCVKLA